MIASQQGPRTHRVVRSARASGRPIACPAQPFRRELVPCRQRKHVHDRTCTSSVPGGTEVAGAASTSAADATALVDELLSLIEGSDSGDDIAAAARTQADACIAALAAIGQGSRPLENELVFGNYNVAYVSAGSRQNGAPAGGRFRSGIGKVLFRTRRLCQSILQPDLAVNKVEFALFGCIPGAVGLRGRLISIPEVQGGADEKDTAKVFFDPPVLSLPGGIHTRIGPLSSVVLKTTYLDERVRLGKGSRGSLFVFTRGGEADAAGMELVGVQRTTPVGAALIAAFVGALIGGGAYVASRPAVPVPARAAGVVAVGIGALLGAVFWRGGIQEGDNYDRPEVQLRQEATG